MWSFFPKVDGVSVFEVLCRFLVMTILENVNVKIIIKEEVKLDTNYCVDKLHCGKILIAYTRLSIDTQWNELQTKTRFSMFDGLAEPDKWLFLIH